MTSKPKPTKSFKVAELIEAQFRIANQQFGNNKFKSADSKYTFVPSNKIRTKMKSIITIIIILFSLTLTAQTTISVTISQLDNL